MIFLLLQTPLHLAVLTRQPRIVRRLIVAGATVDLRDRVGNTALHLACQTGDFDCVRALTEPVTVAETAAANLRYHAYSHQVPQNLEERNYDGESLLRGTFNVFVICISFEVSWFHYRPCAKALKLRTIVYMTI